MSPILNFPRPPKHIHQCTSGRLLDFRFADVYVCIWHSAMRIWADFMELKSQRTKMVSSSKSHFVCLSTRRNSRWWVDSNCSYKWAHNWWTIEIMQKCTFKKTMCCANNINYSCHFGVVFVSTEYVNPSRNCVLHILPFITDYKALIDEIVSTTECTSETAEHLLRE